MQTTRLERGTVSGRVALLLRSAEIQPPFFMFSFWTFGPKTPLLLSAQLVLQGGLWWWVCVDVPKSVRRHDTRMLQSAQVGMGS